MDAIDVAIGMLEEEILSSGHGTKQQPKDGTAEWFILRARSLGLSHLRRMKQLGAHLDAGSAERFHRGCAGQLKHLDVPPPVEVKRETLPDGSLPTGMVQ